MKNSNSILKMTVLAMLIALGVVISPILRVEGMCPMAHFINIVCSVFLGPWYSLLCATLIGIIRMATMGIPPAGTDRRRVRRVPLRRLLPPVQG